MNRDRREIDDELRAHRDMLEKHLQEQGMEEVDAHEEARRRMGDTTYWARRTEAAAMDRSMTSRLLHAVRATGDLLRDSLRSLRRNPGIATVAVSVAGVGIAVFTTLFSVVNAVAFRPLPFEDPGALVALHEDRPGGVMAHSLVSPTAVDLARSRTDLFEAVGSWSPRSATVETDGRAERVSGARVSDEFFRVLGMAPGVGRLPRADEIDVVVLTHREWSRRGGGTDLDGLTVTLDGRLHPVVGVMPPEFGWGRGELSVLIPAGPAETGQSDRRSMSAVARLAPGVDPTRASRALAEMETRLTEAVGDPARLVIRRDVADRDAFLGDFGWVVLGAGMLLLIVTCSHVAGLLLARSLERTGEMAVRTALGGSRGRLFGQVLLEAALLGGVATLIGVASGVLAARGLASAVPDLLPWWATLELDMRIFGFAALAAVATILASGVAPALLAARAEIRPRLGVGAGRGATGPGSPRLRSVMLTGQLALTFVLFVSAVAVYRSIDTALDTGLRPVDDHIAEVGVPYLDSSEPAADAHLEFRARAIKALLATPEIEAASWTGTFAPLSDADDERPGWRWIGAADSDREVTGIDAIAFDGDPVRASGLELVSGRLPRPVTGDDEVAERAEVMLSRTVADELWPAGLPPGASVRLDGPDTPPHPVVGVVEDERRLRWSRAGGELESVPAAYLHWSAAAEVWNPELTVRSTPEIAPLLPGIASDLSAIDRSQPIQDIHSLREENESLVLPQRILASVFGLFAFFGGLLSAVGLYGLVAYSVELRRREIGIRVALGADAGSVVRLVTGGAARIGTAGVVLGLLLSAVVAQVLTSMLFGVSLLEPSHVLISGAAILGVTALASLLPTCRVLREDPHDSLRHM